MPVEGTPVPTTPGTPGDGTADAGVRYVDVPTTKLYNDPLYGKPRGVRVDRGLSGAWIRTPLFSSASGAPLVASVGPGSDPPVVDGAYAEASGIASATALVAGTLSGDGRTVAIELPTSVSDSPGVYVVQFRIVDGAGVERERNSFWVYVDRGLWGSDGVVSASVTGPPTTAELRNALRDHPGANRLLGEYEFDVAELGMAVVSAVQSFHAEFPRIPCRHNTCTWPVSGRRPLIDGALAYLFETAADYHRRGMMPYSAGNVSIDDLNKEKNYLAASQMYRERFVKWCKFVKTNISVMAAFGSSGSGYPGYSTY